MSDSETPRTAKCVFCLREVPVIVPATAAPFFKKHQRGGSGPFKHSTCRGSLMAAPAQAAQKEKTVTT